MFAERLKILIKERGLTARQIEKDCGVNHSYWKDNEAIPNGRTIIKLCEYFDTSADWLLGLSNFRRIKR